MTTFEWQDILQNALTNSRNRIGLLANVQFKINGDDDDDDRLS